MSEIFTVCGSKHLYPHKVFGRLGHGPIWRSDQNTGDLRKKQVNIGIRMSHYKDPDEPTHDFMVHVTAVGFVAVAQNG